MLILDNISHNTLNQVWNFNGEKSASSQTSNQVHESKPQAKIVENKPEQIYSEPVTSSEEGAYIVQKDDYVYKIARKFNCSPSSILKANNLKVEDKILWI